MKIDGKYRFSLQFPATTTKQKAVGEALEMLGNRKSTLVVNAVFQYKSVHPELFSGDPVQNKQETMIPSTEEHKEQELTHSAQENQRMSCMCTSRESSTSMFDNLCQFN